MTLDGVYPLAVRKPYDTNLVIEVVVDEEVSFITSIDGAFLIINYTLIDLQLCLSESVIRLDILIFQRYKFVMPFSTGGSMSTGRTESFSGPKCVSCGYFLLSIV